MREFTVDRAADGRRLDALLGELTHGLPQPLLYKFLRKGRVRVNGKRVSQPGHRLQAGDRLECYLNDEFFQRPSPENAYLRVKPRFQVVYEDENILLADKYPGLLVLPDREEGVNTLEAQIQRYLYDRGEYRPGETFPPALCNRIDRWTGGIVIAAKNQPALEEMLERIRLRQVQKTYWCVVLGRLPRREGTLTGYLFKDSKKSRVYVGDSPRPGAKEAVTHYRVLRTNRELSLVEARLVTGRTHQIRAQFAAAGHPLLGDGKYGREPVNRRYHQSYQALYSREVTFIFPPGEGVLQYLSGRRFQVAQVPFEKLV
ncbi:MULTISPECIES: RluA family pseudouridine synthase [Eubacteriales]|uniref:RNA pseudouridylate synthase n=1 Tax=Bittarella massiliensis (ex Durand et al. 2017) TaxID=1720313 RepID=A0AAQ1RUV9_9FIRM|nr:MULTISPECIES: RluA family pseudouridine synthase [Eubacteriales]ERI99372.1 pseudouridine synthase, RluA family [Clostridium sp. ATCC 29733]MZL68747.1 RluA family pseudouridine synthase [Bittarella massiliensis (ex Durand et al. 2017)]MZL81295.1 RluA family pseudouridine synthase [Bittarella massiliensis (ex Durand et al. 2017)]SHF70626.1 23S rRNA pseudouridine955/2504/2580 synthase [Bittarella massiliensis (ex Durand et al. 2017)]